MDTFLSMIAVVISAIALWVSYRAFVHTKTVRFDDKLMDLRLRIAELRNRALITQSRFALLQKLSPQHVDKELQDFFERSVRKSDDLHSMMFKKPLGWDEKFVNDKIVEIRELESDMSCFQEKVEKLFKKV